MGVRTAKTIVPIRAMDHRSVMGEIQVPRDARHIVVLVCNTGDRSLHVAARCFFENGKSTARCWSEFKASGDSYFQEQFAPFIRMESLLTAVDDNSPRYLRDDGCVYLNALHRCTCYGEATAGSAAH